MKEALQFNNISGITCGFNGSFSILGEKNGHCVLQIYNTPLKSHISLPFAPLCQSVQIIDQIYSSKPTIELKVNHDIHSISLGSDAAMFVENNVVKILDFQTLKIHEISENGIHNGILGPNNVLLSSANELFAYGITSYSKDGSGDVSFYHFLKRALKRSSSGNRSLQSKHTLEMLKEEPKIFQVRKTPSMLWASYNEFIAVENESQSL